MQRILIIQLARMGDLLQSSPLIAGLKETLPGAVITLLVSEETKDMAGAIPGVDEIVGIDFGRARRIVNGGGANLSRQHEDFADLLTPIRGRSFDRVYNLNYALLNARLMGLVRFRKAFCYGLDQTKRSIVRTPWTSYLFSTLGARRLSRFNLVDIYLQAAGLSSTGSSLHYDVDPQILESARRFLVEHGVTDRDRVVGCQVGAGNPIRRWPVDSYAHLACVLTSQENVSILVFGAPSEIRLGEDLERRVLERSHQGASKTRILNLVGKTTRHELAAFVKHCDLLVTPDTGTMHLATAVGTRVLAIFLGSALCHETGPYGEGHVVIHPRLACYPCFEDGDLCSTRRCQSAISPECVAQVADVMLGDGDGTGRHWSGIERHDDVDVLRSRMHEGYVDYVPVQPSPLALEQVVAQGYRAMWRGVLNNEWSSPKVVTQELLKRHHGTGLGEDHLRELHQASLAFGDIASRCAMGHPVCDQGAQRLEQTTKGREEKGGVWVRPLAGFLRVVRDDIQRDDGRKDLDITSLFARVARGAALMSDFLQDTVDTCQSSTVGVTDGVSGKESEHPATERCIAGRAG